MNVGTCDDALRLPPHVLATASEASERVDMSQSIATVRGVRRNVSELEDHRIAGT
jgi:hypothetical protein